MSQQRQFQIVVGGSGSGFGGSAGGGGVGGGGGGGTNVRQYHDTTYTKLFVGGLAWETQRDTMRSYFEQFGEILEAVVITDKNTGRSKGYGFVTFKDPEAAFRACQNPSPMIDGRRANCNLAAFGAQKPKPPPIQQVAAGPGRLRPAAPPAGLVAQPPAYPGPSSTYFHQPSTQLAFPYSAYGYSGYSHDTLYPMNYYNAVYGGQQFSPYYTAGATAAGAPSAATATAAAASGYYHNYYPYYSPYAQSSSQAHGLQYQYHPQLLQYQYLQPHHFTTSSSAGILSLPTTPSPLPLASTVAAAATPAAATMTTVASAGATTTTVVAGPVIPGSVSGPSKVTGVASEQSSSTA